MRTNSGRAFRTKISDCAFSAIKIEFEQVRIPFNWEITQRLFFNSGFNRFD